MTTTDKEILLHGTFGKCDDNMPFFDGFAVANQIRTLSDAGAENIVLRINSIGGKVFDLVAIVSEIAKCRTPITTFVEGFANSSAFILAMCGKKRYATSFASFMTHNPFILDKADVTDEEKQAIDVAKSQLLSIAQSCGVSPEKLSKLMDVTTTMDAKEAKREGIIDNIIEYNFKADGDERTRVAAYSKFAISCISISNITNSNITKSKINMEEKELKLMLNFMGVANIEEGVKHLSDLKNQIANLRKENETTAEKLAKIEGDKIANLIDEAVKNGRIEESKRADVVNICKTVGFDAANIMVSSMKPAIVNIIDDGKPAPATGDIGDVPKGDFFDMSRVFNKKK
jgi:ATP-dependent protease ClpP protease subunit